MQMKRLAAIGITVFAIIVSGFGAVAVSPVHVIAATATAKDQVCAGVGTVTGSGGCTSSGSDLGSVVKLVLDVFSSFVGLVAVVMFIWGGFKYITSGGDAGKVTSAKNTLIYAVIGVVVVVFAQTIVQFVVTKTT
jgi:hypothetical protein